MQSNNASGSPWGWVVALALGGVAIAGLSMFREGQRAPAVPVVANPVDESAVVAQAIEAQSRQLPDDAFGLGHLERSLLLKVNGQPQRTFEIAGGLLAIAQKHLALSNATEAQRVAQVCADLVPNTLTSARSWILCGDAAAFAQPDLPLSLRFLERADQVLSSLLAKQPGDEQTLRLRAELLLKLAQSEAKFHRTGTAMVHLRELTSAGPLAKFVSSDGQLQATLTLSQLLSQPVPTEESEKLRTDAWKLGTEGNVSPAGALRLLRESIPASVPASAGLFAPPVPQEAISPARTVSLLALWNTKRFEGLPEWFQIGDELASDYFFHEPRRSADFEMVCRKLLVSMPKTLTASKAGSEEQSQLESIYAANLLLAVSSAQERGDQSEVTRLKALFEETFRDRDITFTAPLERPAQRMHRIGEIYRETMTGHVEQLKQLRASPVVPEPR